jgi:lipopolysaccharide export system permease protein
LLTGLMVVNGETLGPWGNRQADAVKAAAMSDNLMVAQYSGLWAREGDVFLNARTGTQRADGASTWLELRDVRLYAFDDEGRLESVARAGTAEHRPGGWLLRDVVRTTFLDDAVEQERVAQETWESNLDDTALLAGVTRPRYLSAEELQRSIAYYKRNGLDASEFEEVYWGRWFFPLNVLALCLAAIPFAFGTLRSGGLGKRLFIGIVFALGFIVLQEWFVRAANAYDFSFIVAYLVPPIALLGFSALLFRRRSG